MLCGLALGVKRGGVSQLAYVGAGVAGVPVFNEGKSGLNILIGPTGGYLVAFGLVAMLLGYFAEKGWTTSILKTAAAMAIGDGLVLLVGSVWLSAFLGWKNALLHGVVPFLVPEFLKAIVVIIALPSAWKLVKR
jgi:biotin transport system substrate-specific component